MDPSELHRMFQMFDRNGDGKVTQEELMESLGNLGVHFSGNEMIEMMEKIDIKGDGYIDMEEFGAMYETIVGERDEEEDTREAFNVFDQNNDGFITAEELKSVLASLGLKHGRSFEDCKRMIKKADIDGNEMVDYYEFSQLMKGGGFTAFNSS